MSVPGYLLDVNPGKKGLVHGAPRAFTVRAGMRSLRFAGIVTSTPSFSRQLEIETRQRELILHT